MRIVVRFTKLNFRAGTGRFEIDMSSAGRYMRGIMNKRLVLCLLALWFGCCGAVRAEAPTGGETLLPGVALSQGITEITGVAISPLLGVSTIGAWQYWRAPRAMRAGLPWYAQPWAWGTGLAVLGLCFLKDTLGTAVPGLLKKPLDMVELFENKLSALVASSAFVPLVAAEMARHVKAEKALELPTAVIGLNQVAVIDLSWLMIPAAVVSFLVIWVCSHTVNVLMILSPFSTLDAALKLARFAVLALVALAYVIAPWLGAALCLVIFAVALRFAPSALRLMMFGSGFASDILLRRKSEGDLDPVKAFSTGRLMGVPARSSGSLSLDPEGRAAFRHRRGLVFGFTTTALPGASCVIARGLLAPSLVHADGSGRESELLLFLPRYKGRELELAQHFGFDGARDHALAGGISSIQSWLRGLL